MKQKGKAVRILASGSSGRSSGPGSTINPELPAASLNLATGRQQTTERTDAADFSVMHLRAGNALTPLPAHGTLPSRESEL